MMMPKKLSYLGHSAVIFVLGKLWTVLFCIHFHASEFVQLKIVAKTPNTRLHIKNAGTGAKSH
jgi:hypothetical protein